MAIINLALTQIKSTDFKASINLLLKHKSCPHKIIVEFSLYCAKDCVKYYDKKRFPKEYKNLVNCLDLVGTWLINSSKVTAKELRDAAANAAYAADAAVDAAANAVNAAYAAAYAAHAAYAAAYAAHAAADAAVNAAYAADAAVNAAYAAAANAAYAAKQKEYLFHLILLILKEYNYNTSALEVLYSN